MADHNLELRVNGAIVWSGRLTGDDNQVDILATGVGRDYGGDFCFDATDCPLGKSLRWEQHIPHVGSSTSELVSARKASCKRPLSIFNESRRKSPADVSVFKKPRCKKTSRGVSPPSETANPTDE